MPPATPPAPPTFREAVAYWLRLGFLSFGGPAGQIALMHDDLVERRRWISERRFLHALNYCMVLPGPEAQQLATYIGWLMHRTWGGLVAGGLFVLPSLLILIALSWVYLAWGHVPAVAAALYGIKPAVTAIVVSAAVRIGKRTLRNAWLWGIAAAAFVAIFAAGLPFPLIVIAAGLIGHLGGRVAPAAFTASAGHGQAGGPHAPAVIDDTTPVPSHARFTWARFARVLAACLGEIAHGGCLFAVLCMPPNLVDVVVVPGIAIEIWHRPAGISVRGALFGHFGHGVQDQHFFPEGAFRLDRRHASEFEDGAVGKFVCHVRDDLTCFDGNGVGPGAALDPYSSLDIAVAGSECAVIADHQDIECILVPIGIEAKLNGEMATPA